MANGGKRKPRWILIDSHRPFRTSRTSILVHAQTSDVQVRGSWNVFCGGMGLSCATIRETFLLTWALFRSSRANHVMFTHSIRRWPKAKKTVLLLLNWARGFIWAPRLCRRSGKVFTPVFKFLLDEGIGIFVFTPRSTNTLKVLRCTRSTSCAGTVWTLLLVQNGSGRHKKGKTLRMPIFARLRRGFVF